MPVKDDALQSPWNHPTSIFAEQLSTWDTDGYVILKGFFAHAVVKAVKHLVDQLWSVQTQLDSKLSVDVYLENPKQERHFRKQEYWPQPWRLKRAEQGGHYYMRPHQAVAKQAD